MSFYKKICHEVLLDNNISDVLLYCHGSGIIQGSMTPKMHLVTKLLPE